MSIKLHKSPLNVADFLNVMKRADVRKYRQAVKTMQCEKKKKKLQNSLTFSLSLEKGKLANTQLQHIRKWPLTTKVFLSTFCCKQLSYGDNSTNFQLKPAIYW